MPAIALFMERAQAVDTGIVLDADNAHVVVNLCHRLGGLPLAIELGAYILAAYLRDSSPQEILRHFDLRLLARGRRDQPPRHQTLQAAIAWSYDLLTPGERALLQRLSVFRGGCTLEAAEAVCNAEGDLPMAVLEGLLALMEKSLLQQGRAVRAALGCSGWHADCGTASETE